jgi:hypothetical protein
MVLAHARRMQRADLAYPSIRVSAGVTFHPAPSLRRRGAEAPRAAKRTCKPERRDAVQLRNQLGAQARELLIGDRS